MCVTAKNFGLQEENTNTSKPQESSLWLKGIPCSVEIKVKRPLNRKKGWGTTERERWTEKERKREGGCSVL